MLHLMLSDYQLKSIGYFNQSKCLNLSRLPILKFYLDYLRSILSHWLQRHWTFIILKWNVPSSHPGRNRKVSLPRYESGYLKNTLKKWPNFYAHIWSWPRTVIQQDVCDECGTTEPPIRAYLLPFPKSVSSKAVLYNLPPFKLFHVSCWTGI